MINKLKLLLQISFWNKLIKSPDARKNFFLKNLRVFILAIKGFGKDRVQLRASALTYYTLFSVVPMLATFFGIAKGFGFDTKLKDELMRQFTGQKEVMEWILNFTDKYLANIKGGYIAGVGLLVLIWSVMRVFGSVENSFNDIWQIKKSRGFSRKFSDYVSLIIIAPILVILSSSVTVFLNDQIRASAEVFPLIGYVSWLLSLLISLIPFVLLWMVLALLYLVMPNTKVNVKAAIFAGIIAGTLFQAFQWGYINFQSLLSGYGAIYGSFAALPLFLMWLQLSWLIVLLGAELSFAYQNLEHYEEESQTNNISHHYKRIISLLIVKLLAINFKEGIKPMTAEEIASKLDLPVRLGRDILYELLEVGIVSETVTKNAKETAFQPAQDLNRLTISFILDLLDKNGTENFNIESKTDLNKIIKIVDGFGKELSESKLNKKIYEIE